MNSFAKQKQRHRVENKHTDAKEGSGGQGWIGRLGLPCAHCHVQNRWLTRTGCVVQGTLLNTQWWPKHKGSARKRGICIHVADSFCSSAKSWHSSVKQLYSNKKKKKVLVPLLPSAALIKTNKQLLLLLCLEILFFFLFFHLFLLVGG